jgi:O-acetyl-ADP-ribose deacetylase (regulator of RNase III)
MPQLPLANYSSSINLHEKYRPAGTFFVTKEKIVNKLLQVLLNEDDSINKKEIPKDYQGRRSLLRGLLNKRAPGPLKEDFLNKLDSLLQTELKEKGVVDVEGLEPISNQFPHNHFNQSDKLVVWQGDITRLNADVIVNAANKQMLGCLQPLHACIDNAIHSAAGPQLREDCQTIMTIQRDFENTGDAKITRGYNLPSKFVLHTVGPIIPQGTALTEKQMAELASCYLSCLELAHEVAEIKTVAFCAISTGVFGFPKSEAAQIAVHSVNEWLAAHPNHFEKIIFNVFSEEDYLEYLNVFQ